ncbi:hypothetical protein TNCV_3589461 [Trichonephila clavipes]|nr:hypothetical protein TNCV_3589461 [Trichonephila clavipes]
MAPWPRAPVIPQLVDRKTFRDNRWPKGASLLPWSARSPDLFPTENILSWVAERLHYHCSPTFLIHETWHKVEAVESSDLFLSVIQAQFDSIPNWTPCDTIYKILSFDGETLTSWSSIALQRSIQKVYKLEDIPILGHNFYMNITCDPLYQCFGNNCMSRRHHLRGDMQLYTIDPNRRHLRSNEQVSPTVPESCRSNLSVGTCMASNSTSGNPPNLHLNNQLDNG